MTTATAPGKTILVGEHAVVYGRPAIAAPVWQVVATATVTDGPPGAGLRLRAPDVGIEFHLADEPGDAARGTVQPLAVVTRLVLERLGLPAEPGREPDWVVEVRSQIPIAGGLGSGAALSAALVRALFAHAGQPLAPAELAALVYASERHYHGTPSGIDNTVIAYGTPIWFVRGQPPVPLTPKIPFTLLVADSGIRSPTKETVGDVRRGWQAEPSRYERRFDAIAELVREARAAIEQGETANLGRVLDQNHRLLAALGVSAPPLDRLVAAARRAGALGAKLSGGGRGGNVIALVTPAQAEAVQAALLAAGAVRVIETTVRST
jgi:mevalonate kinase